MLLSSLDSKRTTFRLLFDLRFLATASLLALATPVLAKSLGDFLKAHPECREINDGCSVCRVVDGNAHCSTPGTACIIKGWQCVDGTTVKPIGDKQEKPKG